MLRLNITVGAFSVGFGALILFFSQHMSMFDEYGVPGERFWPFGLAWLFIALGVFQWIETLCLRHKQAGQHVNLASPGACRAYVAAVVAIVFGIILDHTGFVIASLLFVPTLMTLMGERRVWFIATVTIVTVATIYVFFTLVFNSPLPTADFLQ